MTPDVSLWPLIGVAFIIAGFILRFNPMIVVIGAAIVTAFAAGFGVVATLSAIGTGFLKARNLTLGILLPLATIGLLERHGLRQHAQSWIQRFRKATAGQLLIVYLAARELTAAIGLTGLGGHRADGAAAGGAHGRGRRRGAPRAAARPHPLQAARVRGCHRQRRPVLRRGHLRRLRRHRPHHDVPEGGPASPSNR